MKGISLTASWIYILAIMLGPTVGAEMTSKEELQLNVEKLGSSNFLESTNAANYIYEVGPEAIPALIGAFSSDERYLGLCGRGILESQSEGFVDLDDYDPTKEQVEEEVITVREVALYLVVAILKGDQYFADTCKPNVSSAGDEDAVMAVLQAIEKCYQSCIQEGVVFEYATIEPILEKYGVSFSDDDHRK